MIIEDFLLSMTFGIYREKLLLLTAADDIHRSKFPIWTICNSPVILKPEAKVINIVIKCVTKNDGDFICNSKYFVVNCNK